MGVMDWFSGLSPEMKTALIMGGTGLAGSVLTGIGAQGRDDANREADKEDRRARDMLTMRGQDMDAAHAAGQMMGGSPLAFQRERQNMALQHALLSGNFQGGGVQAPAYLKGFTGKVSMPKFGADALRFSNADAMANAEVPYWQALAGLDPDINPNIRAAGYGNTPGAEYASGMIDQNRLKKATDQALQRQAIMGAIDGAPGQAVGRGAPPEGYEYDKKTGELKKKGGGFWKKLGKIALGVGGGIATAMTGGALAPLVGAGFGALSGAIDNGWKGAAMGAGLGALGGVGGGAGSGVRQGFGQAVKSTLTNPRVLTNAAGMGIGGKVGMGLQLGSNLLPSGFGNSSNFVRQDAMGAADRIGKLSSGGQLPGVVSQQAIQQALRGFGGQQGWQPQPYGYNPTENVPQATDQINSRQLPDQRDGFINSPQMLQMILQMLGMNQQSRGGYIPGAVGGGIGGFQWPQQPISLGNSQGLPPWIRTLAGGRS